VAQIEAELSDRERRIYGKRFDILPGITGPVQILGRTKAFSGDIRQALLLDLLYVERRSFALDLKILAKTILAVCKLQGI
jgi:lipopolysaccharide/colanic/teichoic acid biosynthesis glycosyltransferase